ncbi:MAG TPA: NADPH-dependent FMN reductase [Acidimicrobiaceae bacterium]|nr:NADPH-dependent FMN reductase [Acidimicrobiaceae bacterium]
MPLLQVIVASTRPGRVGRTVAEWFAAEAEGHDGFDVELVDLAEVDLPLFDEPEHPRLQQYEHDHTRRWSETISRGDAFAFVMPEYNFGYNAALKNAIDFLWTEWNDKPVALVGYGGVSGGLRAMQLLKPVLTAVKLRYVAEVPIPFVHDRVQDGSLEANDPMRSGAAGALDALAGAV